MSSPRSRAISALGERRLCRRRAADVDSALYRCAVEAVDQLTRDKCALLDTIRDLRRQLAEKAKED